MRDFIVMISLSVLFLTTACGLTGVEDITPTVEPIVIVVTATDPPTAVPTATPQPTRNQPTPTELLPPSITPTSTGATNGIIIPDEEGVEIQDRPGVNGTAIRIVDGQAPVTLVGRTEDLVWVQINLIDGVSGWILTTKVRTDLPIPSLNITGVPDNPPDALLLATQIPEANVRENGTGLRFRDAPGLETEVLSNLEEFTPLRVMGRTSDNEWLQVQLEDNRIGWVAANFVDVNMDLNSVPVTGQVLIAAPTPPSVADSGGFGGGQFGGDSDISSVGAAPSSNAGAGGQGEDFDSFYATFDPSTVIYNITPNAVRIFQTGQQLGRRANVFTKVGDNLTTNEAFFYPIGEGQQNLGQFGGLQRAIDFFSTEDVGIGNSFSNVSLSAHNGWTSSHAVDVAMANRDFCQPGELPFICEYRVVQPAFALIMLGANDVPQVPVEQTEANLRIVITETIGMGIVPIVVTMPPRTDQDIRPYNTVIVDLGLEYDIPIWHYSFALNDVPNQGISGSGPTTPPDGPSAAANFTGDNLQYGYTIKNLTGLMLLDALLNEVVNRA